jgi:hypothetical protein
VETAQACFAPIIRLASRLECFEAIHSTPGTAHFSDRPHRHAAFPLRVFVHPGQLLHSAPAGGQCRTVELIVVGCTWAFRISGR